MKNWVYLLVGLFTLGCHDDQELITNAKQLAGTWNTDLATEKRFTRWTFDSDYMYMAYDSLQSCQRVQSQPYQYWFEKNVLVTRYAGITNAYVLIQPVRYRVLSLNSTTLTVLTPNSQRLVFEKCR